MAEHLYGEEWDSDEFQTALKVVLKCELQSLLERLSETGEETVLLTASATDLCVGHLASPKALRFVNSADVGIFKNKFLNFLTGKVEQVPPVTTQKTQISPAVTDSSSKKSNIKTVNQNQTKVVEKRPLESATHELSGQLQDTKRRKTDSQLPLVKGNVNNSLQTPSNQSATQALTCTKSKGAAPKLKTTKVVSKSGGFTEERISDAEFQKFLAQYKPNVPEGEEESGDQSKMVAMPQISSQKQCQSSQVPSVLSTQNKVTSLVNNVTDKNTRTGIIQPAKLQSSQPSELKKDNYSVKMESINVNMENKESVSSANIDMLTEIKEEKDSADSQFKKEVNPSVKKDIEQNLSKEKEKNALTSGNTQKKEGTSQSDRAGCNQNRNRLESIDNLDTETLIQMTKAKHLENMSEADREIQAKLGQLSSKLSWVVEYPKEKGQPGSSSQTTSAQQGQAAEGSGILTSRMMLSGMYHNNENDELEVDDEEFDDDEEDFDEDDLDEEDKAALKAMREAHMRKLANSGIGDFREEGEIYEEGFNVSQNLHQGMVQEDYDEEEYEGFEEYSSEGEILCANMANVRNNAIPGISHGQKAFQRNVSPTSENFLMIGPIMAKCLICNKIVRKIEMTSHHEAHLNEEQFDVEEEVDEEEEDIEELEANVGVADGGAFHEEQKNLQEEFDPDGDDSEYAEEEEEYPQEEDEYSESYEFQAGETQESMEYTGEKFVAEKLVAEKIGEFSDSSKDGKDNICEICNKSFKSHGNLLRHRKNIHKLKEKTKEMKDVSLNCTCPVCGKSFRYLQKHIRKMHPELGEHSHSGDVSENSGDSQLNCNICGEFFTEEEILKEHYKIHA